MQEVINHKTITVYIRDARVTAQTLRAALCAMLRVRREHRENIGSDMILILLISPFETV